MPPLPRRLFVSAEQVERILASRGRAIAKDAFEELPSIKLPGKRAYSVNYLRTLIKSCRVLSREGIRRFQATRNGERALAMAKKEFEEQLRKYTPYTDPERPSLVTTKLLATTLFCDTRVIGSWCAAGRLPHRTIDNTHYFEPNALLEHFAWSH